MRNFFIGLFVGALLTLLPIVVFFAMLGGGGK